MTWDGKLGAILEELPELDAEILNEHLHGNTSAEWLAEVLRKNGHDISASTIRTQRRTKGVRG